MTVMSQFFKGLWLVLFWGTLTPTPRCSLIFTNKSIRITLESPAGSIRHCLYLIHNIIFFHATQYMLDHLRVQLCLQSIGRYIQVLVFRPINNFYNLYEFMNMISFYAERGQGVGSRIHTLQYTFPCNMATSRIDESVLYGTGGSYSCGQSCGGVNYFIAYVTVVHTQGRIWLYAPPFVHL